MQKGVVKTTLEKLIEAEAIIKEMKAMRALQIKYFTDGRSTEVLNQSKIQERKVDQMINEYFAQSQQSKLF